MILADVLKKEWITIREGAELIGVSVQRVHQLIETYELETDCIHNRLKVMRLKDAVELRDRERPSGVHLEHQH